MAVRSANRFEVNETATPAEETGAGRAAKFRGEKVADVEQEPLFIPLIEVKKYAPGPRFIIERRRRAMIAGKGAGREQEW